jgi:hypothetical protein
MKLVWFLLRSIWSGALDKSGLREDFVVNDELPQSIKAPQDVL